MIAFECFLGYKNNMKRGLRNMRCSKAETNRFQTVAFSLIELLITVLIIMVLTTMYWGGNSASRQKVLRMPQREDEVRWRHYRAERNEVEFHGQTFPMR